MRAYSRKWGAKRAAAGIKTPKRASRKGKTQVSLLLRRRRYRARHIIPTNVKAFEEFVKEGGPLDKALRKNDNRYEGWQCRYGNIGRCPKGHGCKKPWVAPRYKPSVAARKTEIDATQEALAKDDLKTFVAKLRDLVWDPAVPFQPPYARSSAVGVIAWFEDLSNPTCSVNVFGLYPNCSEILSIR